MGGIIDYIMSCCGGCEEKTSSEDNADDRSSTDSADNPVLGQLYDRGVIPTDGGNITDGGDAAVPVVGDVLTARVGSRDTIGPLTSVDFSE
jgi:hypothetical protein